METFQQLCGQYCPVQLNLTLVLMNRDFMTCGEYMKIFHSPLDVTLDQDVMWPIDNDIVNAACSDVWNTFIFIYLFFLISLLFFTLWFYSTSKELIHYKKIDITNVFDYFWFLVNVFVVVYKMFMIFNCICNKVTKILSKKKILDTF